MAKLEFSQPSFEQLVQANPFYQGVECDPNQWQDIAKHNQRVNFMTQSLLDSKRADEIFLIPIPKGDSFRDEVAHGALNHDIGYSLIENKVHKAAKTAEGAKRFKKIFHSHPHRSLDLLGERFIKEHQLAAALILHHQLEPAQHPHADIAPWVIRSKEFRFGLALIASADSIVAANEIRRYYNDGKIKPQEETIMYLGQRLEKANLKGLINTPLAVAVGYEAFKQLSPSEYPGFPYQDPAQQNQAPQ